MPSLVSRPPCKLRRLSVIFFSRPTSPAQPLRSVSVISFLHGAGNPLRSVCHLFFLGPPAPAEPLRNMSVISVFFRPPGAGAAASIISVISFFSASSRRHSRCEMCVSSLLLGPPARPQLLRSVWHLFFSRPPAPAQPLRSVRVISFFCAPLRRHSGCAGARGRKKIRDSHADFAAAVPAQGGEHKEMTLKLRSGCAGTGGRGKR